MLVDPQSITINGTAISMPRITASQLASQYSSADGATKLRIAHTLSTRARSLVRLDLSKVGSDPLLPAQNRSYTASAWLVVDRPLNGVGYSSTEMTQALTGFGTYLSTAGFYAKILGLES